MHYRQRLIGGTLRFVEEDEEQTMYRQRLVGGKLRFVPPVEEDDNPFDEEEELISDPTDSKNTEKEAQHFDDLFNEDGGEALETSSIDGGGVPTSGDKCHDLYDLHVSFDKDDSHHNHNFLDESASITAAAEECGGWNLCMPDWLRQMATSARKEKLKKAGMAVSHDCDKDDGSYTTATTTSDKSANTLKSSWTNYTGTSVPQLVLNILRDELIEVCGNMESVHETSKATLKSYMITKDFPRQKVGLAFATNHKDGAVYICEIKKGSKFLTTGLEVGSRIVSINGTPVPKKPKKLLKMMKNLQLEIVLIAETPEAKVKSFLDDVCRNDDFTIDTVPW